MTTPVKMGYYCLLLLLLFCLGASAQNQHNNVSGYPCTRGVDTCTSYAFYRTKDGNATLNSLGALFNTSAARIANASSVLFANAASPLPKDNSLYIPLSCSCASGRGVYEAPTSHRVAAGDTIYVIAKENFQWLTSSEAIEAANPSANVTNLQIGEVLKVPVRCACPSTTQRRNGSRLLLTYVIQAGDTLAIIGTRFSVSVADLEAANTGVDDLNLWEGTTLLIPLPALAASALLPPVAPPPAPPVAAPPVAPPGPVLLSSSPSKWPLYVGIAVGAFGLALAATLACALCMTVRHYRKLLSDDPDRSLVKPSVIDIDSSAANGTNTNSSGFIVGMSEVMGSDKPTRFSYDELLSATNQFSDANRVQGSVYMGRLNGSFVAIKQMKGNMSNELRILSQVHHGNVVGLVGMCANGPESLYLVYEYAENGSLSDCLHYQMAYPSSSFSRSVGLLSWTLRVQVALDVATGLEYLHNYTKPSLVHKDVKSSNILLDRTFRAKVANFGMAKTSSAPGPIMTEHIVGTHGYMAPEYLEHGLVTTKADVFSFGVVLLELLSGKEAMSVDAATGQITPLSAAIFRVLSPGEEDNMPKVQAFVDSRLQDAYPRDIAYSVACLAKSCVDTDLAARPDMKECTFALSKMLRASQDWKSTARFTNNTADIDPR